MLQDTMRPAPRDGRQSKPLANDVHQQNNQKPQHHKREAADQRALKHDVVKHFAVIARRFQFHGDLAVDVGLARKAQFPTVLSQRELLEEAGRRHRCRRIDTYTACAAQPEAAAIRPARGARLDRYAVGFGDRADRCA